MNVFLSLFISLASAIVITFWIDMIERFWKEEA